MRLGVITDTCHGYGRWGEDCYKKMREHGFSCSDYQNLVGDNSIIYAAPQEEADAILLHERTLAEEAGIQIWQAHAPWRYPVNDGTEEVRAERLELMKKSIRAASLLGCRNWVVHPIMPYGLDDAGTENAQKTWDLNLSFMTGLLNTAKEYNITICFENMPFQNFSLSKPAEILRFAETINDENFKICFDTGHAACFDDVSVGDAVRMLGSKIRAFHIHDDKGGHDLHLFPYFGFIDWEDFARALKDISFDGVFSLEVLPSGKLPLPIFEEMCESLVKIAKNIINNI